MARVNKTNKRQIGKVKNACFFCRKRKIKCNGIQPCSSCIKHKCKECIFETPPINNKPPPLNFAVASPLLTVNASNGNNAPLPVLPINHHNVNIPIFEKPNNFTNSNNATIVNNASGQIPLHQPVSMTQQNILTNHHNNQQQILAQQQNDHHNQRQTSIEHQYQQQRIYYDPEGTSHTAINMNMHMENEHHPNNNRLFQPVFANQAYADDIEVHRTNAPTPLMINDSATAINASVTNNLHINNPMILSHNPTTRNNKSISSNNIATDGVTHDMSNSKIISTVTNQQTLKNNFSTANNNNNFSLISEGHLSNLQNNKTDPVINYHNVPQKVFVNQSSDFKPVIMSNDASGSSSNNSVMNEINLSNPHNNKTDPVTNYHNVSQKAFINQFPNFKPVVINNNNNNKFTTTANYSSNIMTNVDEQNIATSKNLNNNNKDIAIKTPTKAKNNQPINAAKNTAYINDSDIQNNIDILNAKQNMSKQKLNFSNDKKDHKFNQDDSMSLYTYDTEFSNFFHSVKTFLANIEKDKEGDSKMTRDTKESIKELNEKLDSLKANLTLKFNPKKIYQTDSSSSSLEASLIENKNIVFHRFHKEILDNTSSFGMTAYFGLYSSKSTVTPMGIIWTLKQLFKVCSSHTVKQSFVLMLKMQDSVVRTYYTRMDFIKNVMRNYKRLTGQSSMPSCAAPDFKNTTKSTSSSNPYSSGATYTPPQSEIKSIKSDILNRLPPLVIQSSDLQDNFATIRPSNLLKKINKLIFQLPQIYEKNAEILAVESFKETYNLLLLFWLEVFEDLVLVPYTELLSLKPVVDGFWILSSFDDLYLYTSYIPMIIANAQNTCLNRWEYYVNQKSEIANNMRDIWWSVNMWDKLYSIKNGRPHMIDTDINLVLFPVNVMKLGVEASMSIEELFENGCLVYNNLKDAFTDEDEFIESATKFGLILLSKIIEFSQTEIFYNKIITHYGNATFLQFNSCQIITKLNTEINRLLKFLDKFDLKFSTLFERNFFENQDVFSLYISFNHTKCCLYSYMDNLLVRELSNFPNHALVMGLSEKVFILMKEASLSIMKSLQDMTCNKANELNNNTIPGHYNDGIPSNTGNKINFAINGKRTVRCGDTIVLLLPAQTHIVISIALAVSAICFLDNCKTWKLQYLIDLCDATQWIYESFMFMLHYDKFIPQTEEDKILNAVGTSIVLIRNCIFSYISIDENHKTDFLNYIDIDEGGANSSTKGYLFYDERNNAKKVVNINNFDDFHTKLRVRDLYGEVKSLNSNIFKKFIKPFNNAPYRKYLEDAIKSALGDSYSKVVAGLYCNHLDKDKKFYEEKLSKGYSYEKDLKLFEDLKNKKIAKMVNDSVEQKKPAKKDESFYNSVNRVGMLPNGQNIINLEDLKGTFPTSHNASSEYSFIKNADEHDFSFWDSIHDLIGNIDFMALDDIWQSLVNDEK
ncbi:uncharacterized protein SCODWIG_02348 [Saccharomycodes ludwigii]|uniref:Zn(2)-C6 fungal-type domain-containing protein n=1 Tax=Saccharomycodes ludwigii TaxID=36035 RepID=A0A376B7B2_9ASCO|nr:uncharacterized protein SCODWIG_02348 [Saccharomycodes ludwigii]